MKAQILTGGSKRGAMALAKPHNMLSQRVDAFIPHLKPYFDEMRASGVKMDANETMFIQRELRAVEAVIYKEKFTQIIFDKDVVDIDVEGRWVRETSYKTLNETGRAKFVTPSTTDLPRVGAKMTETSQKVEMIGLSFGWSWEDIEFANHTGLGLETELGMIARRTNDRKVDDIFLLGDTKADLPGLLSNVAEISKFTVPNGDTGNTEWSTKTPQEIINDINGLLNTTAQVTNDNFEANILILPTEQYRLIKTKRIGTDAAEKTILQHILDVHSDVNLRVFKSPKLNEAVSSKDTMVCYPKTREVLSLKYPMPFTMFAAREDANANFNVPCYSKIGGVARKHPKAIVYGNGI